MEVSAANNMLQKPSSQQEGHASRTLLQSLARAYGIHSSILNMRWNGSSTSKEEGLSDRRSLNTQQDKSFIDHISQLPRTCAAHTPAMATASASQFAGKAPNHCWISRLMNSKACRSGTLSKARQTPHCKLKRSSKSKLPNNSLSTRAITPFTEKIVLNRLSGL
jgi:hypothetical protein